MNLYQGSCEPPERSVNSAKASRSGLSPALSIFRFAKPYGFSSAHRTLIMATAIDPKLFIEQLRLLIKNPSIILDHGDEAQRSEIQRLSRQASIALETTQESMQRVMFSHLPLVTTKISNSFDIFATLAKGDSANPVALSDLVRVSGLNKSLVSSIMDYHCWHGAATEPLRGFFVPTRLTHSLVDAKVDKTTTCWHEVVGPAYAKLHHVLKRGPDDGGKKTAFQVAHDTTETFYDFLESRPEKHAIFYGYMAANHSVTAKWIDVLRFDEDFAKDANSNEAVFVDIGGGDGSQSVEVQKVHKLGGRIIMQDRPAVVEKATAAREAGIETMEYDFFTEQPIKAARVYFIQFVLLNVSVSRKRTFLYSAFARRKVVLFPEMRAALSVETTSRCAKTLQELNLGLICVYSGRTRPA